MNEMTVIIIIVGFLLFMILFSTKDSKVASSRASLYNNYQKSLLDDLYQQN